MAYVRYKFIPAKNGKVYGPYWYLVRSVRVGPARKDVKQIYIKYLGREPGKPVKEPPRKAMGPKKDPKKVEVPGNRISEYNGKELAPVRKVHGIQIWVEYQALKDGRISDKNMNPLLEAINDYTTKGQANDLEHVELYAGRGPSSQSGGTVWGHYDHNDRTIRQWEVDKDTTKSQFHTIYSHEAGHNTYRRLNQGANPEAVKYYEELDRLKSGDKYRKKAEVVLDRHEPKVKKAEDRLAKASLELSDWRGVDYSGMTTAEREAYRKKGDRLYKERRLAEADVSRKRSARDKDLRAATALTQSDQDRLNKKYPLYVSFDQFRDATNEEGPLTWYAEKYEGKKRRARSWEKDIKTSQYLNENFAEASVVFAANTDRQGPYSKGGKPKTLDAWRQDYPKTYAAWKRVNELDQAGKIPNSPGGGHYVDLPRSRAGSQRNPLKGAGRAEGRKASEFNQSQLRAGTKVELEHTNDRNAAREIAMDHLAEDPDYYRKLRKVHLD